MTNKIKQAVIGGIVATAVMTVVTMVAPMMGMPKMSPPAMLSMMMGVPIIVGWIMHFMIGIIFALSYVFFFHNVVKKVNNSILKGAIFGMAVFVFAQIMMGLMGAMTGGMPAPEGSAVLLMLGSIMGHVVYGIVAVKVIGGVETQVA